MLTLLTQGALKVSCWTVQPGLPWEGSGKDSLMEELQEDSASPCSEENIPTRGDGHQKGLEQGRQAPGTSEELLDTCMDRYMQSEGELGVR